MRGPRPGRAAGDASGNPQPMPLRFALPLVLIGGCALAVDLAPTPADAGPPPPPVDAAPPAIDRVPPPPPELLATDPPSPSTVLEPTVLGRAEAGAAVRVFLGAACATPLADAIAEADGSFRSPARLPAATLSRLTATATDASGNRSACSAPLAYDTRATTGVAVRFPPGEAALTDASALTLRGSLSDPEGVAGVRVGGVEAVSEDGFRTWRATVPLNHGRVDVVVEALRPDGAVAGSAVVSVTRSELPRLVEAELAVDAEGRRAFLASAGVLYGAALDGGVLVPIPDGGGEASVAPAAVAWDADRGRLYVGGAADGRLLAVDPDTGRRTLVSGPGRGVGPLPGGVRQLVYGGGRVFLSSRLSVLEVDADTGDRRSVAAVSPGAPMAWSAATEELLFVDPLRGGLGAYDPERGGVRFIRRGGGRGSLDLVVDASSDVALLLGSSGSTRVELEAGESRLLETPAGVLAGAALPEEDAFLVVTGGRVLRWREGDGVFGEELPPGLGAGPRLVGLTGVAVSAERLWLLGSTEAGPTDEVLTVDRATGERRRRRTVAGAVDLAVGPAGEAYVRDVRGELRRIDPVGFEIEAVAPALEPGSNALDANGDRLFATGLDPTLAAFSPGAPEVEVLSGPTRGSGPSLRGVRLAVDADRAILTAGSEVLEVDVATGDRSFRPTVPGRGFAQVGVALAGSTIWAAAGAGVFRLEGDGSWTAFEGPGPAFVDAQDVALGEEGAIAWVADGGAGAVFALDGLTSERVIVSR
jgi:hypothetical protein